MAVENTSTVKSVTSGTQLSSVGTVKTVVGLVKAVDANGSERILQAGDKVYANETIVTSADGGVIIEFQNGSFLDLPRSAHIMLDPEIYAASTSKSIEQEAADEASRIARAIAEGRDPNAVADPAAAGGETGDEGTTTPLVVDFDNTQGDVTSGFPTGTFALAFPPPQEELLPLIPAEEAAVLTAPTVDATPPVYSPPDETPLPNNAVGGIVSPGQVFEEGLDPDGTNKETPAEIALGGTIVINDAEGLTDIASLTIGNQTFTFGVGGLTLAAGSLLIGQTVTGAHGTLEITAYDGNGTFTYSYTLTSNTTDGAGDETDSFGVIVTDKAGLSASTSIVITIIDDVPLINITDGPAVGALNVIEASGSGEGKEATTIITPPVFTYLAGADGLDTLTTTYALTLAGGTATGLVTTIGGYPITLSVSGDGQTVTGLYNGSNVAFTITLTGTTVTLVSNVALEHSNTPQGDGEDNELDISTLINVTATITVTDNDGDVVTQNVSTTSPLSLEFVDTNPTITSVVAPTLGALSVIEASGSGEGKEATTTITGPTYTATAIDGVDATKSGVTYALTLAGGTATGLVTTIGGYPITLSVSGDGQTVTGLYNGSNVAFTITLTGTTVTLVSNVALEHSNTPQGDGEDNELDISTLINVTATITVTDNDGDVVTQNVSTTSPLSLEFVDTNPTITSVVAPTLGALSVIEASGSGEGKEATTTITGPTYTATAIDGVDATKSGVTYALTLAGGTATGLVTTIGGYPITLSVSGDGQTVTGLYNGSNVAFTITLTGTTVTLVSNVALEHSNTPQGDGEDNELDISTLINVTATITVTDNDGDVVTQNVSTTSPLSLEFVDTNPTITSVVAPTLGALSVIEASGSGEGKEATTTITGPTYTATAIDGVDATKSGVTYALTLAGGTATGLVTTIGGYPITLSVSGDGQTVTGLYNGSNVAFTITLTGTTVTLVSNVALEHSNTPQGDGEDNELDISTLINVTATITVTDNDGDVVTQNVSTTSPLSLEFTDTDPVSLNPDTIHMIDLATAPAVTKNLNFVSGADGVQTVKFIIADGAAALDTSTGNHLSFNGEPLYLHYGQTNGTIDYTILVATTVSGIDLDGVSTTDPSVAYWIDINPETNTYTMHSNGVISNGTETAATNLSTVGGGNVEFKAIQNIGGTTEDVIVSASPGGTVNSNANTIGVAGGNSINLNEGIRFDLVDDAVVTGSGNNAELSYAGVHNLTNNYRQVIAQIVGTSANITVTAIIADSDSIFYGDNDGEIKVNLATTDIKIYNTLGQDVTGSVVLTDNPNGSITINGMLAGWTFEINSTTQFSAVQIDGAANTSTFKLGLFSYGQSSSGDPVDLSYNIQGVDGDGDTVDGTISATLYPAGATQVGVDDSNPNDVLNGTANTDYLLGNLGNDVLSGLGGDDLLIGGPGNDTLTGGSGKDTFLWNSGDAGLGATDTITDFVKGVDGDVLNLADLLQGETVANIKDGGFLTSATLADGNTILVFDTNGAATGGETQTIVLEGVDLTNGNSYSTSQVLNQLLQEGNLKVDS